MGSRVLACSADLARSYPPSGPGLRGVRERIPGVAGCPKDGRHDHQRERHQGGHQQPAAEEGSGEAGGEEGPGERPEAAAGLRGVSVMRAGAAWLWGPHGDPVSRQGSELDGGSGLPAPSRGRGSPASPRRGPAQKWALPRVHWFTPVVYLSLKKFF